MIDLEPINSDIRRIIEKTEKVEKGDLNKERIAAKIFLFQLNNAALIIKWNYFCLKHAVSEKDPLDIFGEPLSKQDLEKMKKQTKELSGLINKLCELLNMSRSEMENELNLLLKLEWENVDD